MANLAPEVTVVVPAYNAGPFIKEAMVSVIEQTYPHWQAIVVNNFSTDDTVAIIQSLGDSRIKVIDFANQGVIAASRNRGIALATSKYIAFLDADDVWHKDKLARCVEVLESGADIVSHGEIHFKEGEFEKPVDYGPTVKSEYANLLCDGNCFSTSAVVCRLDLIKRLKGFDETKSFITAEDYDLWLRIMASGSRAVILPEMLGKFRIHKESASSAMLRHYRATRSVLNRHYCEIFAREPLGVRFRYLRRFIKFILLSSALMIKKREVRHGMRFLWESFALKERQ